ncbi:MAG: hypothetical protein H6842_02645 [Rhodospirillaceae bacterium]|nr:hypothetical protein [Rhodospirillaceae bacterium]
MLGLGIMTKVKAAARSLQRHANPAAPLRDPTPLSAANRLGPEDLAQRHRVLDRLGVRRLPYPFSGILALASDTDGSSRADYEFYSRLFVAERGLDFGDSVRLIDSPVGDFPGMKLFGWNAEPPPAGEYRAPADGLTFFETLREAYLGNIDHFHGLMNSGPKIVVLPVSPAADGMLVLPDADAFCRGGIHGAAPMPALGILLHGRVAAPDGAATLTVALRSGGTVGYRRVTDTATGWTPKLEAEGAATLFEPAGEIPVVPAVADIRSIHWGDAGTPVTTVGIVNLHRAAIARCADRLSCRYGIRLPLLTDCTAFAFAGEGSADHHARRNLEMLQGDPLPARYGRHKGRDVFHACYVDDLESFAYALPELARDLGLRFINPAGWTGETGADMPILNLIVPATARDGQGVYVARRALAPLADRDGAPDPDSANQGTLTISRRMAALLDRFAEGPDGCAWVLYTHLGNLRPKPADPGDRKAHFPDSVMDRLQDAMFGITAAARTAPRMMFTRASLAYDYARVLRGLAEHPGCLRRSRNRIDISSWTDPVLGGRCPDAVDELNGLTLQTDDPAGCAVFLDGRPVPWLARNPPDEGGRPSITVVGRGVLHEPLSPAAFASLPDTVTAENCRAEWCADGLAIAIDASGHACLRVDPGELTPVGAQSLLMHLAASSAGLSYCVEIDTRTGGRFRLFDAATTDPADRWPAGPLTAWYAPFGSAGGRALAIPFAGLRWTAAARPGGPLPSHPTAAVTIRLHGAAGDRLMVHNLAFNRPGVRPPLGDGDPLTVGGRADGAMPGDRVVASVTWNGRTTQAQTQVVDAAGWFLFDDLPCGAQATITAPTGATATIDVRRRTMALDLRHGARGRAC